jgi:hypothetical protein
MPVSRVVAVNPSLVVEHVGSDYLMLTASGAEVVRATGDAADVITCAINGQPLPDHLHTAADVLQRHGVLTTTTSVTTANTFTPSRRHALQLGAAAAAVGLTMLALPNAAAAASVVPPTYTFTGVSAAYCTSSFEDFIYEIELKESGTFTLTSGTLTAEIILVGGGGSGSNPPSVGLIGGGGGGGGGGGEVDVPSEIPVDSGVPYVITVGAGGAAVTDPPGGGNTSTGNDGGTTTAFEITVQGGKGGDGRSGGASGTPFSGGTSVGGTSVDGNGGGGGGAGGAGGNGEAGVAGSGGSSGAGYSYDGVTAFLAEGGGGGGSPGAGSGSAGGGTGGFPGTSATAGETNTGSGGGGGYAGNGSGAGGSGIVIVRFYGACGPLL